MVSYHMFFNVNLFVKFLSVYITRVAPVINCYWP